MRAIDADAFKDYIREACEDLAPLFNDNGKAARLVTENFCKDIDEQPTVFAAPKRGKWIDGIIPNDSGGLPVIVCDQCNTFFPLQFGDGHNFCPNCGADMRQKGESSESN